VTGALEDSALESVVLDDVVLDDSAELSVNLMMNQALLTRDALSVVHEREESRMFTAQQSAKMDA
jgi:hypothetical protein